MSMKMFLQRCSLLAACASSITFLVAAQYPPPVSYDSTIRSPINPDITISYKSPHPGTCATTFEHQKQYTGYIRLPAFTLDPIHQHFPINTFFWFVESRVEPESSPLTIWLNGGPGISSMDGFFQENGPCKVVETPDGFYKTHPRPWGWDRSSNVLYIDQPGPVGLSFDTATNMEVDLIENEYGSLHHLINGYHSLGAINGTLGSMNQQNVINNTDVAAHAAWHLLQTFLSAFPQYNPGIKTGSATVESTGIHLFAEGYGGIYGPTFADFFGSQNVKRLSGDIPINSSLEIKLQSLGIINGLVDQLIQAPFWPEFAYDNSYGLGIISQENLTVTRDQISGHYGCIEQISTCRKAVKNGTIPFFDDLCSDAAHQCNFMHHFYTDTGRNPYDIRETYPISSPPMTYLDYLNTPSVQSSIGTQVNFTQSNLVTFLAFHITGDTCRGAQLASLAHLLDLGVRVAFIYGDADYLYNWPGGEAISLALAAVSPSHTGFSAAGYTPFILKDGHHGVIRQHGNLSFTRVYDAGHYVAYDQPETAFTLFSRIIAGKQLSNGLPMPPDFSTSGPLVSEHQNKVPAQNAPVCYLRDAKSTCTEEEILGIKTSNGTLRNGIWRNASPLSRSSVSSTTPDVALLLLQGAPIANITMSPVVAAPNPKTSSDPDTDEEEEEEDDDDEDDNEDEDEDDSEDEDEDEDDDDDDEDDNAAAAKAHTEQHWKIVTISMMSVWSAAFLIAVCWLPRALRSARVVDAMNGRATHSRADGDMDDVGTLGGDYGRGRNSREAWGCMTDGCACCA